MGRRHARGGASSDRNPDRIHLSRIAVENWSRLTHGSEDLAAARQELMTRVRYSAGPTTSPPDWMTTPPPKGRAWCHLPGEVSLVLRRMRHGRPGWQAVNCIAPRHVRQRARPSGARKRSLSDAELDELTAMESEELEGRVVLSTHSLERAHRRAGLDEARLRAAIAENGRVVATPPAWVEPDHCRGPLLLADVGGDEVGMPLAPPEEGDERRSYLAVTAFGRRWVSRKLPRLRADEVSDEVHVDPAATLQRIRALGGVPQENETAITSLLRRPVSVLWHGGPPELRLEGGEVLELSVADRTTRTATGKNWIAHGWRPAPG